MSYRRRTESEREARIENHVAHAMGLGGADLYAAWRKYVVNTTIFPFSAKYLPLMGSQPFCGRARVLVIGLAKEDECRTGLQAKVMDGHKAVLVPLELLLPDDETVRTQAVFDWHYSVARRE